MKISDLQQQLRKLDGAVLNEAVEATLAELEYMGYAVLGAPRGDLVIPRATELAAAINRLRA